MHKEDCDIKWHAKAMPNTIYITNHTCIERISFFFSSACQRHRTLLPTRATFSSRSLAFVRYCDCQSSANIEQLCWWSVARTEAAMQSLKIRLGYLQLLLKLLGIRGVSSTSLAPVTFI